MFDSLTHLKIIAVAAAQWPPWGNWSQCTTTCGPGSKFRARSCSDPELTGSSGCLGNQTQIEPCFEAECPGGFFYTYLFVTLLLWAPGFTLFHDDVVLLSLLLSPTLFD